MSNQVTLTIDGIQVSVPQGTLVVEAAKRIQNEIPVFCYHAKMDPVGMCRVCLVEIGTPAFDRATKEPILDENGEQVIRFFPKPMTACTTTVSEGMVVKVNSDNAMEDRKSVLEFLLTSHPLDCPVCDKGGECPLQDLTMSHGPGNSRFNYEDKQHFPKKYPLGDLIVLDMERCIICARCVRFQDEVAHDSVLAFEERGRYAHIVSYSDPPFDSHYSGNTADICPVGALTTRDFRFGARAWEMNNTPSVCNHCGVGCNTVLSTRKGGSVGKGQIKRVMPRQNESVNEIWICDKGRFGHHFNESDERLELPKVRKNGQLVDVSWSEAIETVASNLKRIKDEAGADAIGGLAGTRLSNEDLYIFQKLFRQVIGTNNIDYRVGLDAICEDETAYTVGVGVGTDIGQVGSDTTLLVVGCDLDQEAPILYLRVAGASVRKGAHLVTLNSRKTKLDAQAKTSLYHSAGTTTHVILSIIASIVEQGLVDKSYVDNHTTGFDDVEQILHQYTPDKVEPLTGLTKEEIDSVAKAFAESENGIILFGMEAGNDLSLRSALQTLAIVTGHVGKANNGLIAVLPNANSRGAADFGLVPHRLPGYVQIENNVGLSAEQMLRQDSSLKGMIIAECDPALESQSYADALKGLDFLVVQDTFMTKTASMADVVLPAKSVAERDGTFTNIERRVQAFEAAIDNLASAWSHWLILTAIAGRIDSDLEWGYASADGVMAEIAQEIPLYKDITFESLTAPISIDRQTSHYIYEGMSFTGDVYEGIQWKTLAESGTEKLSLHITEPAEVKRKADDEVVVIASRYLYDNDSLIKLSEVVQPRLMKPKVFISPQDSEKFAVNDGSSVTIQKNGTSVTLTAQVNRSLREGVAIIPRNLDGYPAEQLVGYGNTYCAARIQKSE